MPLLCLEIKFISKGEPVRFFYPRQKCTDSHADAAEFRGARQDGCLVLLGFLWLAVDGSKAKGEWMPWSRRARSSNLSCAGPGLGCHAHATLSYLLLLGSRRTDQLACQTRLRRVVCDTGPAHKSARVQICKNSSVPWNLANFMDFWHVYI
jgi:hypothetical protein